MLYTKFRVTLKQGMSFVVIRTKPITVEEAEDVLLTPTTEKVEGISSNPKEALCL